MARRKVRTTVSNSGNVNMSTQVGGRPVNFSPISGNVTTGAGEQRGDTTVGGSVGFNAYTQQPVAQVGVQQREGNATLGASVGSQGGGVSGSYNTTQGNNRVGISGGFGAGGASVAPSYQFGKGEGNKQGGQWGQRGGTYVGSFFGPVGGAVGGFAGGALGSAIGGKFNGGAARKEHDVRNNIISSLSNSGLWDSKSGLATNADGSTYDFSNTGRGGEHTWADPTRRSSDHTKTDNLWSYETDYTNDLDYVSYMAGNSLARILAGTTNKGVDQFGAQLGNSFLGKAGYGAAFNQDTFSNTMNNARAQYAKMGVTTKEDMLGLANSLYAKGAIKDDDYAVMQQTAGFVFDNDYNTAAKLMSGRDKGIAEAGKSPANAGATLAQEAAQPSAKAEPEVQYANINGYKMKLYPKRRDPNHPVMSAEEAWASTKPFFDLYRKEYGMPSGGNAAGSTSANVMTGVAAGMGTIGAGNKLWNAATGSNTSVAQKIQGAWDSWNSDSSSLPEWEWNPQSDPYANSGDVPEDYTLGTEMDMGATDFQEPYTFDTNLDFSSVE